MRLAMRIAFAGRPFYAHSRGVEGVAPEGRVRGARKVDVFSVAFFSRPLGMGQAGLRAATPVPVRPGRRRGSVRIEEHLASELRLRFQSGRVLGEGRSGSRNMWPAGRLPVGHTVRDEPCSSPRLDEVRDFNRRRAHHMIRRRSQLRKHLTE